MDTERLHDILSTTTAQLRRGEEVEGLELIDVTLLVVGVDKTKAEEHRDELVKILKDWPTESWGQPIPSLSQGPSYIHIGGVIGDQGAAFQLMALGKVLGLWDIITPATTGIADAATAQTMAGGGFVFIDGYNPK